MSSFKHLTDEQRALIEERLNRKISIQAITKELNKLLSTILCETPNYSVAIQPQVMTGQPKDCHFQHVCKDTSCNLNVMHVYHCVQGTVTIIRNHLVLTLNISPFLHNYCKSNNFCAYDIKFINQQKFTLNILTQVHPHIPSLI